MIAVFTLTASIVLAFYFYCVVREIKTWGEIISAKLDRIITIVMEIRDGQRKD